MVSLYPKPGPSSFGADVATSIAGGGTGVVLIDHSGVLDFGTSVPTWTLSGAFTERDTSGSNSGSVHIQGTLNTSSHNSAVTFNRPIILTGTAAVDSGTGIQVYQGAATIDSGTGAGSPFAFATDGGSGNKSFGLPIGQVHPLASFSVPGGTALSLKSVYTTGAQSVTGAGISLIGTYQSTAVGNIGFAGPVTLLGAVTVTTASSNVSFSSTLTSPTTSYAMVVNKGTGTVSFGGIVGGSGGPLSSLTTDSGGIAAINATAVTTTGNQTYNGPVTLGVNSTLTTATGNIGFMSTLGSPVTAHALIANKGTGTLSFDGVVGGSGNPLSSLTTDSGGNVAINASGVTTTGPQTYNGPVTLESSTTLSMSVLTLGSTLTGSGFDLTITNSSAITLALGNILGVGHFTNNGSGTTTVGGPLTTTASQIWADPVTLNTAVTTLSTSNSDISFNTTLDALAAGGARLDDNGGHG